MPDEIAKPAPAVDRVSQVLNWILSGASEREIVQAINSTFPDAKARPLIVQAMQEISKNADADPSLVRAWGIEASRAVLQQARDAGDHGAALRAIRQIVDLSKK